MNSATLCFCGRRFRNHGDLLSHQRQAHAQTWDERCDERARKPKPPSVEAAAPTVEAHVAMSPPGTVLHTPAQFQRRAGQTVFIAEFELRRACFWIRAYKPGFGLSWCSDGHTERQFHAAGDKTPTMEPLIDSNGKTFTVLHFNRQRYADMLTLPAERDEFLRLLTLITNLARGVQRSTAGGYVHPFLDGAEPWTLARPMLIVTLDFGGGELTLSERDAVHGRRLKVSYDNAFRLAARMRASSARSFSFTSALRCKPLVFLLHRSLEIDIATSDCVPRQPAAITMSQDDFDWLRDCVDLFVNHRNFIVAAAARRAPPEASDTPRAVETAAQNAST